MNRRQPNRPPTGLLQVNRAHSLARGLQDCVIFGPGGQNGFVNLASVNGRTDFTGGAKGNWTNNPEPGTRRHYTNGTVGTPWITIPNYVNYAAGDFSAFLRFVPHSFSAVANNFPYVKAATGGNSEMTISFNTSLNQNFAFLGDTNDGTVYTTGFSLGVVATHSWSRTGGNGTYYANGKSIGTGALTGTTGETAPLEIGGSFNQAAAECDVTIIVFYTWLRNLTAAEHLQLFLDPYCFLTTAEPVFVGPTPALIFGWRSSGETLPPRGRFVQDYPGLVQPVASALTPTRFWEESNSYFFSRRLIVEQGGIISPLPQQTSAFFTKEQPLPPRSRFVQDQSGLIEPVASAFAPSISWSDFDDNQRARPRVPLDPGAPWPASAPVVVTAPPNGWQSPSDQLTARKFLPVEAGLIVVPPISPLAFLIGDQLLLRRPLPDSAGGQSTQSVTITPTAVFLDPGDQLPPPVRRPLESAGMMPTLPTTIVENFIFLDPGDQLPPGWPKPAPRTDIGPIGQPVASALVSGIAWAGTPGESIVSRPKTWLLMSTALSPQVIAPPPSATSRPRVYIYD